MESTSSDHPPLSFQELILTLNQFWSRHGCAILQPYDVEVGAGTLSPHTTLRALGNKPWRTAYVQPCRRPSDGRYGENPNRLQHYYQYQVLLKPTPETSQQLLLESYRAIGIHPEKHVELTAQPNTNILKFAEYLNEKQVPMWIRHVVVPGITDDPVYLEKLGYFIGAFTNLKALDVLPYHDMGTVKYEKLGMEYRLKDVKPMEKSRVPELKKHIIDGIKKRRVEEGLI